MNQYYRLLWELCLLEDHASHDITVKACVEKNQTCSAVLFAKSKTVFSGADFIDFLSEFYPGLIFDLFVNEADLLEPGDRILAIKGRASTILSLERSLLNILMQVCGTASYVKSIIDQVPDLKGRLRDTRKTHPGLRLLEKQAVKSGGAIPHRYFLSDGVLIKENHINLAGGVAQAIEKAKAFAHHLMKIEIEVESIEQLEEAMTHSPDWILLDNFSDDMIKKAISMKIEGTRFEVSGNLNTERLKILSKNQKIDSFAMGSLTYASRWSDLSLRLDLGDDI